MVRKNGAMSFIEGDNGPAKNTPRSAQEQAERELLLLGDQLREVEEQVRLLRRQFEAAVAVIRAGLVSGEGAGRSETWPETAREVFPAGNEPGPSGERAASAGTMPAPGSEAEQALHREARRYARLLVSEIELYRPDEVSEGRIHQDLYSRLQPHISRSRKAYESRYGPSVIKNPDYFDEEVVRTLARGDASVLGPGYPGPSV
ncbi:MAG: hypothetical protein ACRD1N_00160 [Terriglobia bacterium]